MDSRQYIAALRRRRIWVIVPVLIGLAIGLAVTLATPKSYEATAKIFVAVNYFAGTPASQPPGINSTSEFALGRIQSYTTLATTPAVLVPASKLSGGAIGSGSITAYNPPNTSILQITASDPQAGDAAAAANATARSLIATIPKVETRLPDGRSTVNATLVEPASTPSSPADPKPLINLLLGLVLGLASGLALAVIRDQAFPDDDGADSRQSA